jgi:hypothetical protein
MQLVKSGFTLYIDQLRFMLLQRELQAGKSLVRLAEPRMLKGEAKILGILLLREIRLIHCPRLDG